MVPDVKQRSWVAPYSFEPEQYLDALRSVISQIENEPLLSAKALHRILAKHPKDGSGFFTKSELLRAARHLSERSLWTGDYGALVEKLQVKPVRTRSGVTPITVLTQPWPCPGQCIFCPDDATMPKSYLPKEPGAQRAARHRFDPYEQTAGRLKAVDSMGHCTDKVELIVLGGTWSAYPRKYQLWFTERLFAALNDFRPHIMAPLNIAKPVEAQRARAAEPADAEPVEPAEPESWRALSVADLGAALAKAQRENESAHCRCVGYTIETRPDQISEAEVVRIRRLGATRVQIGYQSLNDDVLELNKRGHTVADSQKATEDLRRAGFKIQAHWMANLYGSDPQKDVEDFEKLFSDPRLCPDELKLYPCMLVENTALEEQYRAGLWRPYEVEELSEVLTECLKRVPPYCRVSRVVRDIPGQDLVVGFRVNGLRDTVESRLAERGERSRDIRSREIGRDPIDREQLTLSEVPYETSVSSEIFLQLVTPKDDLAGFLRLSLPKADASIPELGGNAIIREVHVYGAAVPIGSRHSERSQHFGLGTRLVRRAEDLARQAGFERLSVISAIGTRDYYRGLGFEDGELYQHRALTRAL